MINERNEYGVKDSINTYLNIGGKLYVQWSDSEVSKADFERMYPEDTFISRKHKEGFTRVYKLVTK